MHSKLIIGRCNRQGVDEISDGEGGGGGGGKEAVNYDSYTY